LATLGITHVEQCTRFREDQLAMLHGMGPTALAAIKAALQAKGLRLKGA
jgi:hypothetical protein